MRERSGCGGWRWRKGCVWCPHLVAGNDLSVGLLHLVLLAQEVPGGTGGKKPRTKNTLSCRYIILRQNTMGNVETERDKLRTCREGGALIALRRLLHRQHDTRRDHHAERKVRGD